LVVSVVWKLKLIVGGDGVGDCWLWKLCEEEERIQGKSCTNSQGEGRVEPVVKNLTVTRFP
jgi:hypothetical protein